MTFTKNAFLFCLLMSMGISDGLSQLSRYQPMAPDRPIDFAVVDTEGAERHISDFRGRVVLINFWASWCPPCVAELPSLENLAETFPNEEFIVLAVSKDLPAKQDIAKKLFSDKTQKVMPLFFDDKDEGAKLLEIRGLPTSVILDRQGRIIGRLRGATVWDHHEVQDLIQRYINGETPQPLSWWQRFKKLVSLSK